MNKNEQKPLYYVLNYSGGKDSSAMLLEYVRRRERERERATRSMK